ncbi:MAG: FtsX-like permease family protein [Bacteroidota bacterium]
MKSNRPSLVWLFRMAWRDSRRSRSKLLLFTSSIILGVAALVAIRSFGENLQSDIDGQAQELLGADLLLNTNQRPDSLALAIMDSLGGTQSDERNFASMVFFPKSEASRLVQIRALEGGYPYYGHIETEPAEAARSFQQGPFALVDQTLMVQFGAEVGDSVRVGSKNFVIKARLLQAPGQNGITASVTAPVYIPMQYLEETGLVKLGSRIQYNRYFQFEDGQDVDGMVENLKPQLTKASLRATTVQSRKEDLGEAFADLTTFLNLVGFVALLLGCVGVASAVTVYVKEKIKMVAVLRCLGLSGSSAFLIFLIQILVMGLIGSIIGALLGSQIQLLLPTVLKAFLPFESTVALSWSAILAGLLVGVSVALLFALIPLLPIRNVSPLHAIRAAFDSQNNQSDRLNWLVYALIGISVLLFSYWQIGEWKPSFSFVGGLAAAFLLIYGTARLVMWLTKKYFPVSWSYLWRQSLANLYRPNNQTLSLMTSIGLGTALIATLYFVQALLIDKVAISDLEGRPNMVLFDIQTDQKDEIAQLTRSFKMPIQQEVPVVTMRLEKWKGRSRFELLQDTVLDLSKGMLNREYRVTFRDSLIESEEIIAGEWQGTYGGDTVFISVEEGYAKRAMKVDIGDEVVFNVQGRLLTTVVGSIRKVDWQRVQTNFLVLFPEGVLEQAPQFHVLISKASTPEQAAKFQRAVTVQYPNVSIIDLGLILSTFEQILQKVSFAIRFMAMFSILTGFLVLIDSVIVSRFQRMQESVLLRTLGAMRRQILSINALEYLFLGGLASGTGLILALLASWALAYFAFDTSFVPPLLPMLGVFASITVLTMIIGMLNSQSVVRHPPLEVLRREG